MSQTAYETILKEKVVAIVRGFSPETVVELAKSYLAGGIRGMERGTLSEERNPDGSEHIASMELVRLAFPRRVFTLSQTEYVIDRVKWLYDHRHLVGGLRFVHEPKSLRFFTGKLEPVSDWPEKLLEAYRADFGEEQ